MKRSYILLILILFVFINLDAATTCTTVDCESTVVGQTGCIKNGATIFCNQCKKGYRLHYTTAVMGTCTGCAAGTGDDGTYQKEIKDVAATACAPCSLGTGATAGGICTACTVAYCYKCKDNPTTCTGCKSGFFLTGNTCNPCPSGTYSQANPNDGVTAGSCTACPAGTYRLLTLGSKPDDCQQCDDGTGSAAGSKECFKCDNPGCQQCNGVSSNCTKCKDGYYNAPSCTKCMDLCKRCPNADSCDQAASGYYLKQQSPAVIKACSIEGCGICDNQKSTEICNQCQLGYKSQKIGNNSFLCTKCPDGQGNDRLQKRGNDNTTDDVIRDSCKACNVINGKDPEENCIACSIQGLQVCDQCKPGYELRDNKCELIPLGANTCETWKGRCQTDCLSCFVTRTLNQVTGTCECAPFYYESPDLKPQEYEKNETGKQICKVPQERAPLYCLPCDASCPQCNATVCLKCPEGQLIAGPFCVQSGDNAFGYYEQDSKFFPCDSSCLDCNGQLNSNCIACAKDQEGDDQTLINYFLHQGVCYQKCPTNYIMSDDRLDCEQDTSIVDDFTDDTLSSSKSRIMEFIGIFFLVATFAFLFIE